MPLNLNFRSQPPLIDFFNLLFNRIFTADGDGPDAEKNELGFVEHESSEAHRVSKDEPPLVELLIDLRPDAQRRDPTEAPAKAEETPRERDAWQLTQRIASLVAGSDGGENRKFKYSDIALLFKAMPEAWVYESALRRAGIPYLTVQGKGFYEREEITDLIQLLRFLDNKTDDLALAAVLRSPLCGVSDNALLALRCAPGEQRVGQGVRCAGTAEFETSSTRWTISRKSTISRPEICLRCMLVHDLAV